MKKLFNKMWNVLYTLLVYLTFVGTIISAVLLFIKLLCYNTPIIEAVRVAIIMVCFIYVYTKLKGE